MLLQRHLMPPLLPSGTLDTVHLRPGRLERLGGVPGLPSGAGLPGPNDHPFVERLGRQAELDADPPGLLLAAATRSRKAASHPGSFPGSIVTCVTIVIIAHLPMLISEDHYRRWNVAGPSLC